MPAATSLVCPKCSGPMLAWERNGVTIDRCGECRGIFLDRGELERLIDLEQRTMELATGDARWDSRYRGDVDRYRGDADRPRLRDRDDDDDDDRGRRGRRGFLTDLLEFGD